MTSIPTLTLTEVAERIGKRPLWLRKFVKRRNIPVLRAGRDIRFDDLAENALYDALRARSVSSHKAI